MAFSNSRRLPRNDQGLDRPWQAGDPIPVPEAVHKDSDSAWALWTEVSRQYQARFAETAPMSAPMRLAPEERSWANTVPASGPAPLPAAVREAQPLFTLEGAMLVARRNNRVCPRPERWSALAALLPPRKTPRGSQLPPAAPTGAAWSVTPPLTKRLCFREQVEWAERAGVLESVMDFMHSMSEGDWLHMGED